MKKRLLVPLSVLMVTGNAEGMQAASLSTVELASTMAAMPDVMGLPGVQEDLSATPENFATILSSAQNGAVISLGAGTYKDITIDKQITLLITTSVTLENLTMTTPTSALKAAPTVGYGMVVLQGSGSCTVKGGTYINNVSGVGQDSGDQASYIFALDENATGSIEISNANLQLKGNNQRAIGNRSNAGTFTVTGTTITGETGVYKNTIGIYCADMGKVTMDGGSISGVKYGIQVSGSNQEVELKGNAKVTGWAALYLYDATSATVTVGAGSVLIGKTFYTKTSNDFGTIVYEGGSGCKVISSGTIQNAYASGATAKQYPVLFHNSNENTHTLELKAGTVETVDAKTPFLFGQNKKANVITKDAGVSFKSRNADCFFLSDATGVLNATASADSLLSKAEVGETLTVPAGAELATSIDKAMTVAGDVKLSGNGVSMKGVTFTGAVTVSANSQTLSDCTFQSGFKLTPSAAGSYSLAGSTFAQKIEASGNVDDTKAIGGIKSVATTDNINYERKVNGKYAYAWIVGESAITQAFIDATNASTIVNASSLTSAQVLEALNKLTISSVTALPAIICSDAFIKVASSAAEAPAGLLVKTYTGNSGAITLERAVKIEIAALTGITGAVLEDGQTLALSKITGTATDVNGKTVAGTFSWSNPGQIVTEGSNLKYPIRFAPADPLNYGTATGEATISKVTKYFTLTPAVCTNGRIEIENKTSDNRYPKGTSIKVSYLPDADYKIDKATATSITLSKNDMVSATFVKIQQKVTIATTGTGTLSVKLNDAPVATGQSYPRGSVLVVNATPSDGQRLKSLTWNGVALSKGSIVVGDKDVNLAATFEAIPQHSCAIKVEAVGGRVSLSAGGKMLNPGDAVTYIENASVKLTAMAIPNTGYEFTGFGEVEVEAEVSATKEYTIDKSSGNSLTVKANFKKKNYTVEAAVNGAVSNEAPAVVYLSDTKYTSSVSKEYDSEVAIKVKERNSTYRIASVLINGTEYPVPAGEDVPVTTLKVAADTKITVVAVKLAAVKLNETAQTYTYDGEAKGFALKTEPSGLTGFTVTYNDKADIPTTAGSYKVKITRPADNTYQAFTKEIANGLVIKKAVYGVAVPEVDVEGAPTSADAMIGGVKVGEYAKVGELSSGIASIKFTPTDNTNYAEETFSVLAKLADAKKVAIKREAAEPGPKLKSSLRAEVASDYSLTLDYDPTLGSLVVLNSTEVMEDVYESMKVKVQAIPFDGVQAEAVLTSSGSIADGNIIEVTLSENRTVKAVFTKKETPAVSFTSTSVDYTGSAFGGATAPVSSSQSDWNFSYVKDAKSYSVPIEAGEYAVVASRPEDGEFEAYTEKTLGAYTINKVKVAATDLAATPLMEGDDISMSTLTGKADAAGNFAWVITEGNNLVKHADESLSNGTYTKKWPVSFTLSDQTNYELTTAKLEADVTVTKAENITLHYATLSVDATKGTAIMSINGSAVQSGTQIVKDDIITVTATPNSGYVVDQITVVPIDAVSKEGDGWKVLNTDKDIIVSVTFKGQTPPPGPGEDKPVNSVSLTTTTKTLAVGETFTLIPAINPADATNQRVSWNSSNPTVATVDANGTVTAVATGTTTITVTTEDGGKTATCVVTVTGGATDIEDILADTQIYTKNGDIYIEPTSPMTVEVVNAAGYRFYAAEIADFTQVKVFAGIYFVKLTTAEGSVVRKVIVR